MTKEEIRIAAEMYNSSLTRHPSSERELTEVLVEFTLRLQKLNKHDCYTTLPQSESPIEFIERRFVTADGVIEWNDQVKGYISQKLGGNVV